LRSNPLSLDKFFEYSRERHQVYLRREAGLPRAEWTNDPVLSSYRFCNIYRELDRNTQVFRDTVRERLRDDPQVLLATIAWRWFNRIETCNKLNYYGLFDNWNGKVAKEHLTVNHSPPYVTAAYIIKTPNGMSKLDGVIWCIDQFANYFKLGIGLNLAQISTLEGMWEWLRQFPYMGDFMAYEVVTDLRYTYLLEDAPDILTWANPGPGAARGLCRVLGRPLDDLNRGSAKDRVVLMDGMRRILAASRNPAFWPAEYPAWEMREVEHTLCEFDKHQRATLGEGRPKQRY
jgi:hypothetical protein